MKTFATSAALLVAAGAVSHVQGNLQLISLSNVDKRALCTDGSPAGYYWKPAAEAATTAGLNSTRTWLMYLEGGGWCYSDESCQQRCGDPSSPKTSDPLCSSKDWPADLPLEGLFWPENDTFLQTVNKVFVHYCTSDGHMASADAFGWHFRGADVVQAVISDLVNRQGLGRDPQQKDVLVFGGGSAGGRGAMVHLDYLPRMLDTASPGASANVEVVGFLDSPLWIDLPLFGNNTAGRATLADTTRAVHSYGNVAHLGEACSAANPGAAGWKCMFGQHRMFFVRTPYLLVASQADAFQLGWNVGHEPASPEEKQYASVFARNTSALVRSLRAAFRPVTLATRQSIKDNAVLSWSCYNHDVDMSPAGFDGFTCAAGTRGDSARATMHEALRQFLDLDEQGTTPPGLWVDDCEGFACGQGCNA